MATHSCLFCPLLDNNTRRDHKVDHLSNCHARDPDAKVFSIEPGYLKRKTVETLGDHLVADSERINDWKIEIADAEDKLLARDPAYVSQHGLPIHIMHETDRAILTTRPNARGGRTSKTKQQLVAELIALRTHGLEPGHLRGGGQSGYEAVRDELLDLVG